MADLFTLVKTYRLTAALDQRLRLAEEIFHLIQPELRVFIFSSVRPDHADDILQETYKAIATGLHRFQGRTEKEFWGWCNGIARNKRSDHFRRSASNRLQPTEEGELLQLIDSAASAPVPPGASIDLERALKLLDAAKPQCRTLLWGYYVQGFDYAEIAESLAITYDAARMKITRCLDDARALVA